MKKTTKFIAFLTIVGVFIGTSANIAVAKAFAKTSEKHKVHLTADVVGKVGVTDEEVSQAFEEALGEQFNAEFVDEKGDGVEEVKVVIQIDDADDDDDGTPDAADNDDNGDGIDDSQEKIAIVDLDKESDLLNEIKDTKVGEGMNILISTNDEAHHILKMQTKADPPAEGSAQAFKFKNAMMNGFAPSSNRRFVPKWLKTTFTVVRYTARGISCATGSFSACFGLLVEGYAK